MYLPKWLYVIVAIGCCLPGCATTIGIRGAEAYWGRSVRPTKQAKAYAWHLTGVLHDRRGEYEQAEAAWNKVTAMDEKAIAPRLALIRTSLRQGDPDKALELCRIALRYSADKPELWVIYGELNHRTGHIEEAIAAFNKTIELSPDNMIGYGALVELQESTNDLVAAIDIYERMIENSPDSAALYYQLGINLARIQDNDYARRSFEKVLEMEPRITRARFLLALTLFELGEYENSAEQFRLYLNERPDDADAIEYRAGALARLGRMEEACALLEQMTALNAATPRNYVQLAWILMLLGQTERAQQFAMEGGAYLLADMIFACTLLENTSAEERPATLWDDRFTLDEIETEADLFLTGVHRLLGPDMAGKKMVFMMNALSSAVGFSPSLSLFHARMLIELEKPAEALPLLDGMRANGIVSKYIHYHSAIVHEKLGNFENTEAHLRAYLAIDPDDSDVLNFLGYFYAEQNVRLDEAEDMVNRALKQDPDNPFYLDSLGWIYYKQGRADEAAALIRRAIYGMETDDAELRHHLGDIYLLQGNIEGAKEEWRRALRLDPSLTGIQEKIEKYAPEKKQ